MKVPGYATLSRIPDGASFFSSEGVDFDFEMWKKDGQVFGTTGIILGGQRLVLGLNFEASGKKTKTVSVNLNLGLTLALFGVRGTDHLVDDPEWSMFVPVLEQSFAALEAFAESQKRNA